MALRRRIYMTQHFARWCRANGVEPATLWEAVQEMTHGLIDARLGHRLVKKRLPLPGRGKRGSARTIVATNWGARWCFLIGFAKNKRDNIDPGELAAMSELADQFFASTDAQLEQDFLELSHEGENQG